MSWGTLGSELTLEGASSKSWTLRFERRLAPREGAAVTNEASSVWLVRDLSSSRLYAAKKQNLALPDEVNALVDEAAAWRAACLADADGIIPELVDVFVSRSTPFSVTFLSEFCPRGLIPKSPPLSEAVLLTLVADLATVADSLPSPHGHIAYESLLVDEHGRVRLAGFGAHRSAILRDNPGLAKQDDAFDIGILLHEFVFGAPPPESLQVPESDTYSQHLTDIIRAAFGHATPTQLKSMALDAGAVQRAPIVNVAKKEETEKALPMHVARGTERNVDRLVSGVDIAPSFAALVNDLRADPDSVSPAVFKALFKKPISKDPVCAMRVVTMLHNLMIDGPEGILEAVRKNDKFMDWIESSWTQEAIESGKNSEDVHPAAPSFSGGEVAFYAAMLRRKARFHMLAAGGFSGRWDRTGAVNSDGRDVLVTRRRKVIAGMADVMEMASELGCRLASANDPEAAVKHAALGAIVSECCLAATAALALSQEVETAMGAEKLAQSVGRLYIAARTIVFAVEHVPSAGGEQWVEQFANETPPDIVADAELRERNAVGIDETADIPEDGWAKTETLVTDEEKAEKKRKKELKKKKKQKEAEEAKAREEEEKAKADITAADGALVVHGADEAASQVRTMFGDLLSIDDTQKEEAPAQEASRPAPNMSNAQALATAFGVPVESVGSDHLALPPPDDYDDDDAGGYADFQARQEEHRAVQREGRRVTSTAAWAARSGYSGGAMIVSGGNAAKKGHPAFCQCAICEQEEAQAAAERVPSAQGGANGGPGSQSYGNGAGSSYKREANRSYYDSDVDKDSLDDEEDSRQHAYSNEQQRSQARGNSYYEDDYDSYESVTYSVEDEKPDTGNTRMTGSAAIGSMNTPVYNAPPPMKNVFELPSKLVLNMKKLRTGDKISENRDMVVYKGEYNRETVAVKKLSKTGLSSSAAVEEFRNEVEVMCTLASSALMKCVAASLTKPNYVLVTELMKRGTLFDVLHKSRIKLTWALIRKIAIQIAEGMRHMHEKGVLHRDLKSLNIFVDGSYNVKVGDFGLSRYIGEEQGEGIAGTYQYMSPEVLRGEAHSDKSDVYAYGIVLCEIVSGSPPFHGMDGRDAAERIVKEDIRPSIPAHCQRAYVNLIQLCWATVPSTRPSFAEIAQLIHSTTK